MQLERYHLPSCKSADSKKVFTKRAEKLGITLGPVGYESFTHIFAQAVMAHLERCRVQPAELFVCVLEVETSLLTMRMRRLMRQRAKLNTVNSDVKIPKNSRATPRRGQRLGRVSHPFRDNKFVKNINVCNSAAIKIEAPQLMHRLRGAFQLRKSHPLAAKGNSFKGFTSIRTCDAYRGKERPWKDRGRRPCRRLRSRSYPGSKRQRRRRWCAC